MCLVYCADIVHRTKCNFFHECSVALHIKVVLFLLYREKEASCFINRKQEDKISHLQKMALEVLYKESKYPSHGVIEEFAKLNNLDGATVKVWFNNERQRVI